MKQVLITNEKPYYKANLHCHTTFSDGKFTPEEIKAAYKEKGYHVVAFTDHEYLLSHNDLTDDEFIAITSYELSITEEKTRERTYNYLKTYHLNLYAKDPNNTCHIAFNPDDPYLCNNLKKQGVDPHSLNYKPPIETRSYSLEYANHVIKLANESGFLVCYNHPQWSLQDLNEFTGLEGLWGMEIYNSGSAMQNCGFAPYEWKQMVRAGKHLVCVAADDNHGEKEQGIGYTMIAADEFSYDGIIRAMEQKKTYASTGATFHELFYEDGLLTIKCSPVNRVFVLTDTRTAFSKNETDDILTEITFDLSTQFHAMNCFYVMVMTKEGKMACTNVYRLLRKENGTYEISL